jgi:hypothetical protein
MIEMKGLR